MTAGFELSPTAPPSDASHTYRPATKPISRRALAPGSLWRSTTFLADHSMRPTAPPVGVPLLAPFAPARRGERLGMRGRPTNRSPLNATARPHIFPNCSFDRGAIDHPHRNQKSSKTSAPSCSSPATHSYQGCEHPLLQCYASAGSDQAVTDATGGTSNRSSGLSTIRCRYTPVLTSMLICDGLDVDVRCRRCDNVLTVTLFPNADGATIECKCGLCSGTVRGL